MHIVKGDTKNFQDYQVLTVNTYVHPQTWWDWLLGRKPWTQTHDELVKLSVEADDSTGLLVYQETDQAGRPILTNGIDEIVMNDTVKLLLLLPNIRSALHGSGYRPKLTSKYVDKLKIVYNGPPQTFVKVETPDLEAEQLTT